MSALDLRVIVLVVAALPCIYYVLAAYSARRYFVIRRRLAECSRE